MTNKSALCVGGPLAGQRYATKDGSGFTVPKVNPGPESDPQHEDFKPNKTATVEMHHYTVQTFHTTQGDVEFWVPTQQTTLETITMLLGAYEREADMRGDLMAARRYVAGYASNPMTHPQGKENAVHLFDKIGRTLNSSASN